MKRVLGSNFFDRPTLVVARELLGKFLVRKINGREVADMIVETEAYTGRGDMSSHARMGLTARNKAMFGPPGRLYVYFTYGMHHCMNIVTERDGTAGAVLIRGLEHTNGPARICKKLKINLSHYGLPLSGKSGIWVEDRGVNPVRSSHKTLKFALYKAKSHSPTQQVAGHSASNGVNIKSAGWRVRGTPRINVGGTAKFKNRPWRFVLERKSRG